MVEEQQQEHQKEQAQENIKPKFKLKYDKIYKYLILIPALLFIFCIIYQVSFYNTNHDFIKKDISLKGGTSVTVYSQTDIPALSSYLSKEFEDFNVREISDLMTGEQEAFIVEVSDSPDKIKSSLESYLNITLSTDNSSIEFTDSGIGSGFYKQALFSVLLAFSLMGAVIFLIFSKGWKMKVLVSFIAILPLLLFIAKIPIDNLFYVEGITLLLSLIIYFRYNMPSFFVILCAFVDIIMTLTMVNLLGLRVSTAGIIAFLMLIGYSVDSDILLTTRVLKSDEGTVNERIKSAFKTGITMTMTTIAAVLISLLVTQGFSPILKQIFTILFIGLIFDIFNTWITNACLIKYYVERKRR